jgi:hypothetical protein
MKYHFRDGEVRRSAYGLSSVRDLDAMDRFAPMGNSGTKWEGTNDTMLALNGSTATETAHQA